MFIERALAGNHLRRIVTLNPEIALAGWRHPRFGNLLHTADLVTIDGFGIACALWWNGYGRAQRLTGTDMLPILCASMEERGLAVTFLLRTDGLTMPDVLRKTIEQHWPKLRAAYGTVDPRASLDPAMVRAVNDQQPACIIMNVGGVAQEEWICRNGDAFQNARIIVGTGGAIDYLCGTVQSPPPLMRRLGLEWLWRVARQPWRFRRVLDAAVIFPLVVVAERFQRVRLPRLTVRLRTS